jgi:hypothetical protein
VDGLGAAREVTQDNEEVVAIKKERDKILQRDAVACL